MENLTLVSQKFLAGASPSLAGVPIRRSFALPQPSKRRSRHPNGRNFVAQLGGDPVARRISRTASEKLEAFASLSSSTSSSQETYSVGVNPQVGVPPPSSSIGSPLFWIGVGVGLSALFSWVASNLKKYAMQQAFKTMMSMSSQNSQFGNAVFPSGSPFPFPPPPTSGPPSPSRPAASQPVITLDVPVTKVEASPVSEVKSEVKSEVRKETQVKNEAKKYAFVDVSPEETLPKEPSYWVNPSSVESVSGNGAATTQDESSSTNSTQSTQKPGSILSVEALEKMMEDPTVQKMVYPYLPEEMRNPSTFKWMLQNPQYRQQLEDMLNNMGGSSEWDNRMMDSLQNFDLSSPEVKQQFDQIGLTPEEVISKIMANPEVAMAFQNPRVQAAIMDCSQNPLSIAKYQNDKEIMDVFNKISELFPGMTGSP